MTIIGRMPGGFLLVEEAVAGPASYATGAPPTITFNDLSQNVERILTLKCEDDERQMTEVSIVGRVLTFRIRGDNNPIGTVGDAGDEIADAIDVSANQYRAVAYGR